MSLSTLTVLCPNARRQTVKAAANTKILELLEEVCKKQGLNSREYDLVFQKKHLDVTLTYRLSGVPNNAQLELVKLVHGPRQLADVSVCVQLESDGSRLPPGQFNPSTVTLASLLQTYASDHQPVAVLLGRGPGDEIQPVVSYLSDQVIGHFQLANTSLLDLGLASGRFVIRLGEKRINSDDMRRLDEEFKARLEKKLRLEEIYVKKQSENNQMEEAGVEILESKPIVPIEPTPVVIERGQVESQGDKFRQESKRAKIDDQEVKPEIEITNSVIVCF